MNDEYTQYGYFLLSEEEHKKIEDILKSPIISQEEYEKTIDLCDVEGNGTIEINGTQFLDKNYPRLTIFTNVYKKEKKELKNKIVGIEGVLEIIGNAKTKNEIFLEEMVLGERYLNAEEIYDMINDHIFYAIHNYQIGAETLKN